MSEEFPEFYSSQYFQKVIALHASPEIEWEEISKLIPFLPRGWFELARLPVQDRIEFTQDYWLSQIPNDSDKGLRLERQLLDFFENLEEIGIFATQTHQSSFFDVHMVYSLKNGMGFFQGSPPASDEKIEGLINRFERVVLPSDFLAFLRIHDGFSKYTDTGMIPTKDMARIYQRLQRLLADDTLINPEGVALNPNSLIPFYESYGLHCYQCFCTDWLPEGGIGNLFFAEHERTLSHLIDRKNKGKNLAFASFLEWLIFYLEDIYNV
ncbi:MAG: hypothetical protein S4CHLAM123_12280 [Chlamydiales bacterium]|nr:hypothetical protein [Chlamydiales bacterium]